MKNILIAAILCFALHACTDDNRAKRILEEQGYTNVAITGYSLFACSEDDIYATGFTATSPNGHAVKGTVCCGALKNCTIRVE